MFLQRYLMPAFFLAALLLVLPPGASAADKVTLTFHKDIEVLPVNAHGANKVGIRLSVDKTRVRPGDTVTVYFEADRDCYLTLLDIGTSGKITRLWPNQFSGSDNFVRARERYSFPSSRDRFSFKVSGPEGIERIMAYATSEKDRILREEEFGEYRNGFKSYSGQLKDLVVEASRRCDDLGGNVSWGTAEVRLAVGNVSTGGEITSDRIFVLAVGAPTGNLRFCSDDARGFSGMIGNLLKVPRQNVVLLLDQDATKARFQEAIQWLARETKPEDLVFIYFSGHGTQVKDTGARDEEDGMDEALICYHSKGELRGDDPDLNRILLIDDEFADMMKEVPAKRRVMVVDSCHSGTVHKQLGGNLVSKYLPLLTESQMKECRLSAKGARSPLTKGEFGQFKDTLLAACADVETSYEDRSKKSGLFTYWLLNNTRGGIDLAGAFNAARSRVSQETVEAPSRQNPQLSDEYGLATDIKF